LEKRILTNSFLSSLLWNNIIIGLNDIRLRYMKFKLSMSLLLLLTGCQLTQQPLTSLEQEKNSDSSSATLANTTANTTKAKKSKASSATKLFAISKKAAPQKAIGSPKEQDDLWQRISMQFTLDIPDNKSIDYYRNWYINHPKHLEIVAQRAEPFLYLITDKIEQRNLPLELALLPIVESSFDVNAYSAGKAAGLWQFLSGTAKVYGLKQDYWYDGRRDVDAATDAALDYLSYLNQLFDGDWYHALAAYNSGEGRIARSIARNEKAEKSTDLFSLSLTQETNRYVPKLLALADVLANKEKYGLTIPRIANQPVLTLVEPNEQLDLRTAANYAGIDYQTLREFNPGYNQWATSPSGAQQLLIPLANIDQFNQKLDNNRGRGVQVSQYKVKRGDTISTIALRYNISTKALRQTNKLNSHMITVGQTLLIPTDRSNSPATLNQEVAMTSSIESEPINTIKAEPQNHTVKNGDTLWNIAKRYNVSHLAIAQWNNIKPTSTLKIGQTLLLDTSLPNQVVSETVRYQVQEGDTISEIAMKFKLNSHDIIKWNNLSSRTVLKIGQTLTLYIYDNLETTNA
jgi:membrane-bound lytic murein transglycosylase D